MLPRCVPQRGIASETFVLNFQPDRLRFETKPFPRDMDSMTSHQDPQLIFYDGFVNPDAERFLSPIAAPASNDASQDAATRGHDEL